MWRTWSTWAAWQGRMARRGRAKGPWRRGQPLHFEPLEYRNLLSFLPQISYQVPSYPVSVAAGDFTGNGILDLAVAREGSYPNYTGGISVLVGNGDGSFQAPVNYADGPSYNAVALGDFNGDGKLDLAATNRSSGVVSILLGNGDGSFQAPMNYPAGHSLTGLAVGDFNGDGSPDLVVTNHTYPTSTVSVLLGNGDGSFQAPGSYTTPNYPNSVAGGDLDNNATLDLVTANDNRTVSVLFGNGDGTFQAHRDLQAVPSRSQPRPQSVAVGDFDGNGNLDILTGNYYSYDQVKGSVSVLVGNGDGTFQNYRVLRTDANADSAVGVGDFNNDGRLDFVTLDGKANVYLGNGDDTFRADGQYPSGRDAVAVGDLNGDGYPDLVTTYRYYNTVNVLLNAADWQGGSPAARSGPPAGLVPSALQTAPASSLRPTVPSLSVPPPATGPAPAVPPTAVDAVSQTGPSGVQEVPPLVATLGLSEDRAPDPVAWQILGFSPLYPPSPA